SGSSIRSPASLAKAMSALNWALAKPENSDKSPPRRPTVESWLGYWLMTDARILDLGPLLRPPPGHLCDHFIVLAFHPVLEFGLHPIDFGELRERPAAV